MKKLMIKSLKYLSLLIWVLIIFLPLVTVIFGSFMTHEEFSKASSLTLPHSFLHLENYQIAWQEGHMLRGFFVTFSLLVGGVLGSVLLGSMVAYILARFDFKFKKVLVLFYFIVSMVPLTVSQVSTFKIVSDLGLYNTIWAPMLLYVGADVMMVYIYLQGLEKIPAELDKVAILEGASYFQIYRQIIFPLLRPATGTVIMLKVMSIYNDFYLPYLYMPSQNLNTIATTLYRFIGPNQTRWEVICACIVISMLPMILLYLVLQKRIYEGLTSGSVKG